MPTCIGLFAVPNVTSCVAARCGAADTVCPRPRARTELHWPVQLAVAVDIACSIGVPMLVRKPFRSVDDTLSVSAVIDLDL